MVEEGAGDRRWFGFVVDLAEFAGPLDLLLSLIRREEADILDIPIAQITEQFLAALDAMRDRAVEVTGEFLVMAATLMQLKSRMLLPRPPRPDGQEDDEDADDPRRELAQLLLEYETYREAAGLLEGLAVHRSRQFTAPGEQWDEAPELAAGGTLTGLFQAYERVLRRLVPPEVPRLRERVFRVEEQADRILARLAVGPAAFEDLFGDRPERLEVIATFMALLELIRAQTVRAEQTATFGEILIRRVDEPTATG